jgi:hypothetical protein
LTAVTDPVASLAAVTLRSAIFAVVKASVASLAVVTLPLMAKLSVNAVAMSLRVVFAQLLEIVVLVTTGLPAGSV